MVFTFHQGKLAVQNMMGMADEAANILAAGWIGTTVR